MRILMISDVYFPRINGVSTSIETFRQTLAEHNIQVDLVVPDYGDGSPSTAEIVRIPSRSVPFDPEDRLMSWSKAQQTLQLLAGRDYQLIHIQTPFLAHYLGTRLAKRLQVPVLATYHTLFEEYLHHYLPLLPAAWLRALARRFSRQQCNSLNAVVVPSSAMAARLQAYGVTTPTEILPTGIPISRFQMGNRAGFRQRHGIAPERPVALFVGRVAHEKNIDFLLRMLIPLRQQHPDILLVITGEGPARAALEKEARDLDVAENVLFLGYLNRESELPDAYAGADVFAFASRTETQGLVLLEAMAAGLPVVGLAEMGTRDILLPERGARVAPSDEDGFAACVASVLSLPDEARQTLSEAARTYAQEWSDTALAGRMANLYRSLTTAN